MKRIPTEQIDTKKIQGKLVFLDVDGALTADQSSEMTPAVMKTIRMLVKNNQVFVCSNKPNPSRNRKVADLLGVECLKVKHKKPSKKILLEVPKEFHDMPKLVIGDKWTKDGRFALRIRGQFILTERITDGKEPLWIKISYWLDNLCTPIYNLFFSSRVS